MSTAPEAREPGGPPEPLQILDLTGLPAPVADELRKLVATLRDNLAHPPSPSAAIAEEPPEAWGRRLQAWLDTHAARPITIDDSRESLYIGRGE